MAEKSPPVEEKSPLFKRLEESRLLFKEERVLTAGALLQEVEQQISQSPEKVQSEIQNYIAEYQNDFSLLRERYAECTRAMDSFTKEDGWVFALDALGVKTYYQLADDGTVWLKMTSLLRCPLFDLIAVVNETDLFHRWIPFCNDARRLKQLSRAHQVIYHALAIPLFTRDAVLSAYGVDATDQGCVLLMGKTINGEGMDFPIPPVVRGFGACRMEYNALQILIRPKNKDEAQAVFILNVDPKAAVPQNLLNWVLKKVAGLVLVMMAKEALKVQEEGEENVYRHRVRENPEFYGWLQKRFDEFFDKLEEASDEKSPEDRVIAGRSEWVKDSEAANCFGCTAKFTLLRRRHHCRACGKVFCAVCSSRRMVLPSSEFSKRVCEKCYDKFRPRFEKKLPPRDEEDTHAPAPRPTWRKIGRRCLDAVYMTRVWPIVFVVPYFIVPGLLAPPHHWHWPGHGVHDTQIAHTQEGEGEGDVSFPVQPIIQTGFNLGFVLMYRLVASVLLTWLTLDHLQDRNRGSALIYTRLLTTGLVGLLSFFVSLLVGVLSLLFHSPMFAWSLSVMLTTTLCFLSIVSPFYYALYNSKRR
eukprot:TRINITY_DN4342_c0_g1::TRINITY_DN4342_c0_g1_i1::g.21167::m.21167 TRINITY_DN4342_c0_g1::TRINITY_DN4342_c0_g1_i1::g.21167  ORF type:complete len:596 (-),score=103.44,sp/Q7Z3T8/ZFY16_HUMAN/42.42/1e-16,FYVE/PF01363.16/5.4e-19,START/PF01852.14/9.8e-05,START/PF01852.14/3.7e+03,FYVE_2/PF02318.11/0.0024,RRP7/PF12923.2/0.14,RRP7/PF12923.2/1.2e+02,CRCB/PF02537.10/0.55,HypA/PF01155.14/1.1 TRINITY_DN4342_c0_g1_i1:238-1989(-)